MLNGRAVYSLLAVLVGIIVLVSLSLYLYTAQQDSKLKDSQVKGCERVNVLRKEVNDVIIGLQDFLDAASEARQRGGTPEDRASARAYDRIARRMNEVPVPDCEEVIHSVFAVTP